MTPELVAHLRRVMRGEGIAKKGVAGVAGVVEEVHYARKPQEIRPLRPLRLENDDLEKMTSQCVAADVASPSAPDLDAIEERAALAADRVPACYLDAWARLQCQRPLSATESDWRRAVDDAGRFLDAWGDEAAAMQWSAGELFDVPSGGEPGGLVWRLQGQRVDALGHDHARLNDGRILDGRASKCAVNADR
jgi:hypothetical protein